MYRVGSAGVFADSFPGLPADGFTVTSDRDRALVREDIQFLTWDHPLVIGALDLLLGSEKGNASVAYWPDRQTSALYLEAVYVLECVAPANLHVDRFLSPIPIRVVVDQQGNPATVSARLTNDPDDGIILENPEVREELLPYLIRKTQAIANEKAPAIIAGARGAMSQQMQFETDRLRELKKVNPSVRSREIDSLIEEHLALDRFLARAHLRLDSLRLIRRG
jgi:ATP-dependent helicase HepA